MFGRSFRFFYVSLLAGLLVIGSGGPAFAASASPASDTLSRQEISTAADHTIVFTTPSGVDAPTDTITLNLPNFGFGSVGVGDIELTYGPSGIENSTVLAAFPAVGVWGVQVSSPNVTFTAPTDATAGTIPPNSIINILIGQNAGGTHRLVNPASPGSAQVTIGGTFGDSAIMGVAIVPNDSVSVTAVVPAPVSTTTPPTGGGSQGGGGGGGGGGANAPVISNVQVSVTTSTATITWNTDLASDSQVSYGLDQGYASGTVSDPGQVTQHSITLTGLSQVTLYHFQVASTDGTTFLTGRSSDLTFTTQGRTQPPVISNIQVSNITDTAAQIGWTTDEPATSEIDYGTTAAYGLSVSDPGSVTNRTIPLTGLAPNTTYHFSVSSQDSEGNVASSSDRTFTTLPDSTPPPNVTNLTASPGDSQINLTWTNPTVPDLAGVRLTRRPDTFPTGPNDGVQVFDGNASSFLDTGVINGTTYYYGAYAYDTSGNFASGALVFATPNGPIPTPPTSTPPTPPATSTPPTPPPPSSSTPPTVPPPTNPPPVTQPPPTNPPVTQPLPPGANGPPGSTSGGSAVVKGTIQAQFTSDSGVALTIDANNRVGVIANSVVVITIPVGGISTTTKAGFVSINGSLFSLQLDKQGTSYVGSFTVPDQAQSTVTASVELEDGTYLASTYTFVAQTGINVTQQTITGLGGQGIEGAQVTVYQLNGGAWQVFGSPLTTDADGHVAEYLPNGTYYVTASKTGAVSGQSDPFAVQMNVPNVTVHMIVLPKPIVLPPNATPLQQAAAAAQNAINQAIYTGQVIRSVLQTPQVQQGTAIVAPIALTIAIINAASAFSLFNLFAFLQNLFTQPILLLGRKKRKRWGVVYNSLSKQPIELAIVRLVHFETRLVVQSKVTDKQGRYWFLARKGNYLIEVVKPGFVFPTQYLSTSTEDVELVDLYHGEKIELMEDSIIARNIPLDPAFAEETPKQVLLKRTLQRLKNGIALGSIVMGMIVVFISPNVATAALLVAQIAAYLLFKRLGQPAKAKNWGIIFDSKTRKPLGRVIVRIFDKKFNKLLETQVTDQNGKFGFIVKENLYYITAEKQGYKKYISQDLDMRGKKEAVINQNISLEPAS